MNYRAKVTPAEAERLAHNPKALAERAFAIGYVIFMRLMARRADVLHGELLGGTAPAHSSSPSSAICTAAVFLPGDSLTQGRRSRPSEQPFLTQRLA
jgi:hypothetical protein